MASAYRRTFYIHVARDAAGKTTRTFVSKREAERLKAAGELLLTSLSAVEGEIYQVRNQSGQDPLNYPIKVNNRLASLLNAVNHGDGRPTGNAAAIFADLVQELRAQTDRLRSIESNELGAFNREAARLGLEPVR